MTRPIFDTAAFWNSLTPEQQRAIGSAAIDREIVQHGVNDLGDGRTPNEFDGLAFAAEDHLKTAVEQVIDLTAIERSCFPLPGFAGQQVVGE